MISILKIVGWGGIVFLISALWIGHMDGILLGLLGFCMILISIVGQWFCYTVLGLGMIVEKTVSTGIKVVRRAGEMAKEQKVFEQLAERVNENQKVVGIIRDRTIRKD